MDIQIKKLTINDIDALHAVEVEAFENLAWDKQLFLNELEDSTKHYFVAYISQIFAGYIGFAHIADEAHIMNIAVAKNLRGLGVGGALLNAACEVAKSLNIKAVTLEVSENNQNAISLYTRFGFKTAGLRPNYYGKGDNALILWLILG
jgi:ribosomal-protein-alanine N-acetyltransferase